jgi:hypothetical protein
MQKSLSYDQFVISLLPFRNLYHRYQHHTNAFICIGSDGYVFIYIHTHTSIYEYEYTQI